MVTRLVVVVSRQQHSIPTNTWSILPVAYARLKDLSHASVSIVFVFTRLRTAQYTSYSLFEDLRCESNALYGITVENLGLIHAKRRDSPLGKSVAFVRIYKTMVGGNPGLSIGDP